MSLETDTQLLWHFKSPTVAHYPRSIVSKCHLITFSDVARQRRRSECGWPRRRQPKVGSPRVPAGVHRNVHPDEPYHTPWQRHILLPRLRKWHGMTKLVNSNVGWETSFPVSVAFKPATLPSKQTAQAAAEHKQKVKSLNLNFSSHAWIWQIAVTST